MKRLLLLAVAAGMWGCAPSRGLNNFANPPQIALKNTNWEKISVAIAEFNLEKGRKLDLVRPNELVLYEARHLPDSTLQSGSEEILCKTIYDYTFLPDSVIITSHRYWTHDLDDTSIAEADDTATIEAEQQELGEIARTVAGQTGGGELASPVSTQ